MPGRRKISDEQIIRTLVEHKGHQRNSAKALNVSPQAVSKHCKSKPQILEAVNDILYAEVLIKKNMLYLIKQGNDRAIIAAYNALEKKDQIRLQAKLKKEQDQTFNINFSESSGIKIRRIPVFPGQEIPEIEQKPGEVVIMIPAALIGLWSPKRYFIASSGRAAAKSYSIAREIIARCLEKRTKIGCFRKVEKSIGDSVHTLLVKTINDLNVSQYFNTGQEKITCTLTGSEIVFFGLYSLKNAESVKSAEDLELAWVEEAQQLSAEVWDILVPTIRKDGSEIICSINPRYKDDIVYKTFLAKDAKIHPRAIVTRLSWRDNPWFNDIMREEMEQAKRISHAQYMHIWEGELMSQVGQMIKRAWWKRWDQNTVLKSDYILRFISADTAYSEEQTANYSVLQVWAITRDLKHIDLIDSRRGRWAYPKLLAHTKSLIQEYDQGDRVGGIPLGPVVIEKKASGQSLIQSLEAELPGKQIMGFDPKTADKVVRVYGVQNKIFDGSVRIPNDDYAPWVKPFLDEVSEFSDTMEHEFDDQVDAMTQAVTIWLREVR